jgi:S-formylglutathione hydrolase
METLSRAACHGGVQSFHSHASSSTGTAMRFGVFVPPGKGPFPVLWCLA